jgi:hypothetical protein
MTTEQIIRDQLERATREVPTGLDVETAVSAGRRGTRRRRTMGAGVALAAVAVVGAGAVDVGSRLADDPTHTVVHEAPVAQAPPAAPDDFVPGTGIDEALAAVVAGHLPALPAPDDVYPSDSQTAGPMSDADFASAEDWQAAYTLADGHEFLLMTALASEGPFSCAECDQHAVPGGTVYQQVSQLVATGRWQYAMWFVRDDGSTVGAFDYVPGTVDQENPGDRSLSEADLEALVRDPGLTFSALSGA